MTWSTTSQERAWLSVDLGAVRRNARHISALVGKPLLAMVKADGYGLGAAHIVTALEAEQPWGYGVATAGEGELLRKAGIQRPIVVFTPARPEEVPRLAELGLRPVVGDLHTLEACRITGSRFHVEIDTGMGRSGFRWDDAEALDALRSSVAQDTEWEGIFTHFHSSDTDHDATELQWDRFLGVLATLPRRPALVHAANSAACAARARYAADLVRPGVFLYGGQAGTLSPEPVASLHARVVALRRLQRDDTVSYEAEATVEKATTVATLAIGYADGVPRSLWPGGRVEIHNTLVPILGRITMDMMMVDVLDAPVRIGDAATLFGGAIALDEQAAVAGTNSYELLTRISARVPRMYHTKEPR